MKIEKIAEICYEANREYCKTLGDDSPPPWPEAPGWARQSFINGVKMHLENPEAGPEASHESWMEEKINTGWKYGKKKNVKTKRHPCLVPFEKLPAEQKVKDIMFRTLVHALKNR